jgi:hypothetical protein
LYYTDYPASAVSDSLIAGIFEWDGFVASHRNYALDKVMNEGRNMMNFNPYMYSNGTRELYQLNTFNNELLAINDYIHDQKEQFLTKDNFVMVDPIEIDGVICSRCAYVKENGDTMCYVVEGIGFDSRNMGDLLTPFTREPDPDADYQEYCGLCHVVKDGQIIYKGMRYDPGNMTGIDEVVAEPRPRQYDDNYYNLMGQPVGTDIPTTPGTLHPPRQKDCHQLLTINTVNL